MLRWSTRRNWFRAQHGGRDVVLGLKRYNRLAFTAILFYAVVLLGAVLSIASPSVRQIYQTPGMLFLAGFFAAIASLHALIPAVNRYHFGVMPFLFVLAAAGYRDAGRWVVALVRRLRAGRDAGGAAGG